MWFSHPGLVSIFSFSMFRYLVLIILTRYHKATQLFFRFQCPSRCSATLASVFVVSLWPKCSVSSNIFPSSIGTLIVSPLNIMSRLFEFFRHWLVLFRYHVFFSSSHSISDPIEFGIDGRFRNERFEIPTF